MHNTAVKKMRKITPTPDKCVQSMDFGIRVNIVVSLHQPLHFLRRPHEICEQRVRGEGF